MNLQDYQGVFVFVQQVDHKITGVSYELLGKGKELAADLGTEVTAVLLGYQVEDLCPKLARYGADKIILVDNEALEPYTTEPYAHAMYSVIEKYKPAVVLYGATAIGRDLAPRVSARVHTGLTADCTKLEIDPDTKNLKTVSYTHLDVYKRQGERCCLSSQSHMSSVFCGRRWIFG